jgi:hypothetical protein
VYLYGNVDDKKVMVVVRFKFDLLTAKMAEALARLAFSATARLNAVMKPG